MSRRVQDRLVPASQSSQSLTPFIHKRERGSLTVRLQLFFRNQMGSSPRYSRILDYYLQYMLRGRLTPEPESKSLAKSMPFTKRPHLAGLIKAPFPPCTCSGQIKCSPAAVRANYWKTRRFGASKADLNHNNICHCASRLQKLPVARPW